MCARVYIDINVRVKPPNKTICIAFNCISHISLPQNVFVHNLPRVEWKNAHVLLVVNVTQRFSRDINITIHKFISDSLMPSGRSVSIFQRWIDAFRQNFVGLIIYAAHAWTRFVDVVFHLQTIKLHRS